MNDTDAQEISIDALRKGDRAEFARMVDAYSAPIYRLGLKMLGNAQDAEDILQNTFLNALTHIADFEGGNVGIWRGVLSKPFAGSPVDGVTWIGLVAGQP